MNTFLKYKNVVKYWYKTKGERFVKSVDALKD